MSVTSVPERRSTLTFGSDVISWVTLNFGPHIMRRFTLTIGPNTMRSILLDHEDIVSAKEAMNNEYGWCWDIANGPVRDGVYWSEDEPYYEFNIDGNRLLVEPDYGDTFYISLSAFRRILDELEKITQ